MPRADRVTQATEDTCWNVAKSLGEFSYFDLASRTHYLTETVAAAVRAWERAGFVRRLGKGAKNRLRFAVVDAERLAPKSQREPTARAQSVEGNLWTAMRGLRPHFTPLDLAAHAATEEVRITEDMARAYCALLMQSGHLICVQKAVPGRRPPVYRLVRNTGPLPPRRRMVPAIVDPNSGALTLALGAGGVS